MKCEIVVKKIRSYQTLSFKNGYRSFRKPEYKEYIKEISAQLPKVELKGNYKINVEFQCINKVVGDLDNIFKPIGDILQENKIISDDRYVLELNLKKSFGYKENKIIIEVLEC